ncbi:MAG: helix-turn-helix domain-containing protein [Fibromonadales bacterium]|nr:helix-turn-helix domain-containing protein [Fibromonadales bacterium]
MTGLKLFRERAGFASQSALAKFLDINSANVSGWESGNGFPSYNILKRLFEMGATVEELFGVNYSPTRIPPAADISSEEAADIVRKGLIFIFKDNPRA